MRSAFVLVFTGISMLCHGQHNPVNQVGWTSVEEVKECIAWLQETPIGESAEARRTANAFLLQWISRSPDVHVELRAEIVDMATRNPDLLAIYMGGWVRYALESGEEYPSTDAHIHGMKAVVEFYAENHDRLNHDRYIEKLIKQDNKGKMEYYLRKDQG
jgi:hypothetical protein